MSKPVAFVTGASYGVGAATALALASRGYDLAISATREENLEGTCAQLAASGARIVPVALDLRSQVSIEAAMATVLAAFERLDLLVNNAGTTLRRFAVDVTREEWDAVMMPNVTGTFFLTQQAGRHFIAAERGGAIVNIASVHALVGVAERSAYGISKAAIVQMTRMLAIEWATHNIRVNAVAPGRLDTPSPVRAAETGDPAYMAAMAARTPLQRLATTEEVAEAVAYLASPAAAAITGQVLVLDGGLTAA
jgi:NAD(P)-dependent dehydrogenase (short-subunit alcohol dehydrogenase family)